MDSVKAAEIEGSLKGKEIQGWTVQYLVNHGKSAAVFKGVNSIDGSEAAIKVFDDELIAKYGDESQISRIERELELIDKSHANMVKILAGGVDEVTNNHFLVMEYLDGPNLKDCLADIPPEKVPTLVSQLARCCEYLETLGLAHRDIKPENIVILDDFSRLVLLDFGVVRPYGEGDVTDEDGKQAFVGTLQYSSPEFLLRTEEDTTEGWRALTFYQIGAVIHDLVMRKAIFSENEQPFARLVNAVQHDTPTVSSPSYPSYLIQTAKICLSKKPKLRVQLLDWESFHAPDNYIGPLDTVKSRVSRRKQNELIAIPVDNEEPDQISNLIEDVISHLKVKVRSIRNANSSTFPPVTITRNETELRVKLNKSERHSLEGNLHIVISVEVLDPAASLVCLKVKSSISPNDFDPCGNWYLLHQGIISGSKLHNALGCGDNLTNWDSLLVTNQIQH